MGKGCQTVETSYTERQGYRWGLQLMQEPIINILLSRLAVGAHKKVFLSAGVTFHLSLVQGGTTAIMPTSEKVSTPSRVLTLQPTLWILYWTNSSSKVDTKVPCLTKSSSLIVHCTSWNDEQNARSDAMCQ